MSTAASSLVSQAKEWAGHYGRFANGREGAVLTVALRLRAAWDGNDAESLAELFTDNGSLLIGDDQLRGRDEIRSYMTTAFDNVFRGTRVSEEPQEIRFIRDDVAIAVTQGGLLYPGESTVRPERQVRTVWVIVHREGEWKIFSHQTSPVTG